MKKSSKINGTGTINVFSK